MNIADITGSWQAVTEQSNLNMVLNPTLQEGVNIWHAAKIASKKLYVINHSETRIACGGHVF